MPSIAISETDSERLQRIAHLLGETPPVAFKRVLDHYCKQMQEIASPPVENASGSSIRPVPRDDILDIDPEGVPPMGHTKLLDGRFAGNRPEKTNWNSLVETALVAVFRSCGSVDDTRRLSGAQLAQGVKRNDGYKPVPSRDFSFQGVSAGDAVRVLIRCARALGCEARMEFEWRDKPEAHAPGRRAVLRVPARAKTGGGC